MKAVAMPVKRNRMLFAVMIALSLVACDGNASPDVSQSPSAQTFAEGSIKTATPLPGLATATGTATPPATPTTSVGVELRLESAEEGWAPAGDNAVASEIEHGVAVLNIGSGRLERWSSTSDPTADVRYEVSGNGRYIVAHGVPARIVDRRSGHSLSWDPTVSTLVSGPTAQGFALFEEGVAHSVWLVDLSDFNAPRQRELDLSIGRMTLLAPGGEAVFSATTSEVVRLDTEAGTREVVAKVQAPNTVWRMEPNQLGLVVVTGYANLDTTSGELLRFDWAGTLTSTEDLPTPSVFLSPDGGHIAWLDQLGPTDISAEATIHWGSVVIAPLHSEDRSLWIERATVCPQDGAELTHVWTAGDDLIVVTADGFQLVGVDGAIRDTGFDAPQLSELFPVPSPVEPSIAILGGTVVDLDEKRVLFETSATEWDRTSWTPDGSEIAFVLDHRLDRGDRLPCGVSTPGPGSRVLSEPPTGNIELIVLEQTSLLDGPGPGRTTVAELAAGSLVRITAQPPTTAVSPRGWCASESCSVVQDIEAQPELTWLVSVAVPSGAQGWVPLAALEWPD